MMKHTLTLIFAAGTLAAQLPQGYLEVFTEKVKMGKRLDFDTINKREAEMNRKNGDRWVAYETLYGDSSLIYFVSTRPTFAAAAQGTKLFDEALTRAAGSEAARQKLGNDYDTLLDAQHDAIYRQRWDLSSNVPGTLPEVYKIVGQSRFLRLTVIRTRPGKAREFEADYRMTKDARERVNPGIPFVVSQSALGEQTGVYRITTFLKSLDEMDQVKPIEEVRADSYAAWERANADAVISVQLSVARFVPEISNPPDEIAAADPSFWRPKSAASPKPAAKQ